MTTNILIIILITLILILILFVVKLQNKIGELESRVEKLEKPEVIKLPSPEPPPVREVKNEITSTENIKAIKPTIDELSQQLNDELNNQSREDIEKWLNNESKDHQAAKFPSLNKDYKSY